MTRVTRLEDWLPAWRKACAERVAGATAAMTDRAVALLPTSTSPEDPKEMIALAESIARQHSRFAVDDLLPFCLGWMTEERLVVPESAPGRLRVDAASALKQRLPSLPLRLPDSTARVPYGSWALCAAAGSALGAVLFAPVSPYVVGQREAGLLIGGVAGAGLLVGILAWLSERPKLHDLLQKATLLGGGIAGIRGSLDAIRGKKSGFLRAAAWIAGISLLLLLVRPRKTAPSRDACRAFLGVQIASALAHTADLVLTLCWHHSAQTGAGARLDGETPPLPESIADALGILHMTSAGDRAEERHVKNAVSALLHCVRAEGYEWQSVPDGTPYDPALEDRYACFGLVEGGQPVEVLEPVRLWNGKPDKRGLLRAT